MKSDGFLILFVYHERTIKLRVRRPTEEEIITCTTVELTTDDEWEPSQEKMDEYNEEDYLCLDQLDPRDYTMNNISVDKADTNVKSISKHLLFPSLETLTHTLNATTQLGTVTRAFPLRRHIKSRNPILSTHRISEKYATYTWFSLVTSYEGYKCA